MRSTPWAPPQNPLTVSVAKHAHIRHTLAHTHTHTRTHAHTQSTSFGRVRTLVICSGSGMWYAYTSWRSTRSPWPHSAALQQKTLPQPLSPVIADATELAGEVGRRIPRAAICEEQCIAPTHRSAKAPADTADTHKTHAHKYTHARAHTEHVTWEGAHARDL